MKSLRLSFLAALAVAVAGISAPPTAAQSSERWQMLSTLSRTHDHAKEYIKRFENIKKRSNGRLDIAYVPYGETPHKSTDALRIVRDGLAEMSIWYPAYSSATYPLLGAPGLPFLDPNRPDTAGAQSGADRVWASAAMVAELKRVHGLFNVIESSSGYVEPMNFYMQKPINTPADFKGQRVRIFGPELADLVNALGAVPINLPAPEVYGALQRKIMDGVITSSGGITGLKWGEQLSSGYVVNMAMIRETVITSMDKVDKLPADLRQIFIEEMAAAGKAMRESLVVSDKANHDEMIKTMKFTVNTISPQDYAAIRALSQKEVWPEWVRRTGTGADDLLKDILRTVEGRSS